jgi:hypothetical protein
MQDCKSTCSFTKLHIAAPQHDIIFQGLHLDIPLNYDKLRCLLSDVLYNVKWWFINSGFYFLKSLISTYWLSEILKSFRSCSANLVWRFFRHFKRMIKSRLSWDIKLVYVHAYLRYCFKQSKSLNIQPCFLINLNLILYQLLMFFYSLCYGS